MKGYGFNQRVSLYLFGNKTVAANVTNQYELTCVVPASEAPTKVAFAVTANTTTLYDPDLEFKFDQHAKGKTQDWGIWYVYSLTPYFNVRMLEPPTASTMRRIDHCSW